MKTYRGFLLSYVKYGDAHAVVNCFTDEGFQSFFIRNIFSKKSKQRAFLAPLNEISLHIQIKSGTDSLKEVSKMELLKHPELQQQYKAGAVLFFTADFLYQVLRNEQQNEEIYHEISTFLKHLEKGNMNVHYILLTRFLKISGILPLSGNGRYLDPETGTFSASQTHQLLDEEISELWKQIISDIHPYEITVPSELRKKFLDSVFLYYQLHFSDFRIPGSLEVVQQLF